MPAGHLLDAISLQQPVREMGLPGNLISWNSRDGLTVHRAKARLAETCDYVIVGVVSMHLRKNA